MVMKSPKEEGWLYYFNDQGVGRSHRIRDRLFRRLQGKEKPPLNNDDFHYGSTREERFHRMRGIPHYRQRPRIPSVKTVGNQHETDDHR